MDVGFSFAVQVRNAVVGIYNDLTAKLTPTRAQNLDKLANLTGPVALQSVLGTPTDPPAMNTTALAAVQQLYQQLVVLDRQIALLASAEQVRTLIVPGAYPALHSTAGQLVPLAAAGTAISWNTTTYGAVIATVRKFGLVLPTLALIPSAAGDGLAGTLVLTLNAQTPTPAPVGSNVVYFGNTTTPVLWGLSAAASGGFTLFCGSSSVAIQAASLPLSVHWNATAGLSAYDKSGNLCGAIAASAFPSGFDQGLFNLFLAAAANLYVVAVEYI